MAQHDGVIDNGPGLAVRTDINAALQALLSQNSGPIEPTTMYAGMMWLDTSVTPDGLLRQRNLANTAWVTPTTRPATYGDIKVIIFSSTTSYSKPAGLRFLQVELIGAGGGSGGCAATAATTVAASGGGGGGGYCKKLYKASDLAASESLVLGAGGAGGTTSSNGSAGGDSTFKALTAGGGGGGSLSGAASAPSISNRGGGGSASGGDTNIAGNHGQPGVKFPHGLTTAGFPGWGGACFPGSQGFAQHITTQQAAINGAPGCGSTGGASGFTQGALAGGTGGDGRAVFTEYY